MFHKVLLVEKGTPRGKWPKELIEEVIPGKDRIVREVNVRTANGVFSRHVRQLCLLEGQLEQSSYRPDPGGGSVNFFGN